jgi:hypothetical protein
MQIIYIYIYTGTSKSWFIFTRQYQCRIYDKLVDWKDKGVKYKAFWNHSGCQYIHTLPYQQLGDSELNDSNNLNYCSMIHDHNSIEVPDQSSVYSGYTTTQYWYQANQSFRSFLKTSKENKSVEIYTTTENLNHMTRWCIIEKAEAIIDGKIKRLVSIMWEIIIIIKKT